MMGTMSMRQPENWLYEIWQKGQASPCYVMVPNAKLLAIINDVSCQARCNECFTNGIACLDEQNFSVCIDGRPINVRTKCPTGAVCTAEENICRATAQGGGVPACFEDNCGKCLSAEKNFACLDESIYAFCYDGETPDLSSSNYCPLGNVCDLNNANICSPAQSAIPSCLLNPITDTTTETTTDLTTASSTSETTADTTTETTTDTTSVTTTDTTTESTTLTTTKTTTDATTETTTDTTTDNTIETTTGSTSDITTNTTTSSIADTTTEATTPATTITTTETTTAVTTETTTGSTSDKTTDTTTDSMTSTSTDTTTDISIDTTTETTTVTTAGTITITTTPSTTDTTIQTTSAPRDPNTFCTEIGRNGYFPADGDSTCTKYIYCYGLSGQYLGWEYTCANYFNAATGKCQTARPADC